MSRIPPDDRVPLLVWLGVFLLLAFAGASMLHTLRHGAPPPVNHCPPGDATNRWCTR